MTINLTNYRIPLFLCIIMLMLIGCSVHRINMTVPLKTASNIYNPHKEKGFCMTCEGEIYNIHEGDYMSAPMPLCNKEDIVMHTHPPIDHIPSPTDLYVWQKYHELYGNRLFGIMWNGEAKFYEVIK